MFVTDEPIAVSVDGGTNTIFIRAKMDFGTRQRVAALGVAEDARLLGAGGGGINIALWNLALMKYSIVRWAGPAFADTPCTPGNIERLDPSDPLVDAVLTAINESNRAPSEPLPDPKSSTSSGGSA